MYYSQKSYNVFDFGNFSGVITGRFGFEFKEALDTVRKYNQEDSNADLKAIKKGHFYEVH